MTVVSELKKKTLSVVIVLIFWKKLFMELLEGAKGGGGVGWVSDHVS